MLDNINALLLKLAHSLAVDLVVYRYHVIVDIGLSVFFREDSGVISLFNHGWHSIVDGSWSSLLSEPLNEICFLCCMFERDKAGACGLAGNCFRT